MEVEGEGAHGGGGTASAAIRLLTVSALPPGERIAEAAAFFGQVGGAVFGAHGQLLQRDWLDVEVVVLHRFGVYLLAQSRSGNEKMHYFIGIRQYYGLSNVMQHAIIETSEILVNEFEPKGKC